MDSCDGQIPVQFRRENDDEIRVYLWSRGESVRRMLDHYAAHIGSKGDRFFYRFPKEGDEGKELDPGKTPDRIMLAGTDGYRATRATALTQDGTVRSFGPGTQILNIDVKPTSENNASR